MSHCLETTSQHSGCFVLVWETVEKLKLQWAVRDRTAKSTPWDTLKMTKPTKYWIILFCMLGPHGTPHLYVLIGLLICKVFVLQQDSLKAKPEGLDLKGRIQSSTIGEETLAENTLSIMETAFWTKKNSYQHPYLLKSTKPKPGTKMCSISEYMVDAQMSSTFQTTLLMAVTPISTYCTLRLYRPSLQYIRWKEQSEWSHYHFKM